MSRRLPSALCLPALSLLVLACEKEPTPKPKIEDAGASEKGAAIDPALAKAVAETGKGAATGAGSAAASGDGPPPMGLFAPGVADKLFPKGSAAKLELGNKGSGPTVTLAPMQPKAGQKLKYEVVLTRAQGQRQMPPFTFALTLDPQKPKAAPAPGGAAAPTVPAPGGAAAPTAPAATDLLAVVLNVDSVKIDDPRVPKDQAATVAKLKGSKLRFSLGANGGSTELVSELSAGADPNHSEFTGNLAGVLAGVLLPLPSEPVGVGAVWLATGRDRVLGIDTLAYRMVTVKKIEGDLVTLEVATKRYATSDEVALPGVPAEFGKLKLSEFQSICQGTVTYDLKKGGGVARDAVLADQMGAAIEAQSGKQLQPIQLSVDATLTRK